MIYNRTQEDIDTALSVRVRLQNGETLTDADIEALERGTLTINTLNRIENKVAELKPIIDNMGYNSADVFCELWSFEDYFKQKDFDRILNNIKTIRSAFIVYKNTPEIPKNNYRRFQVINDAEKILYDLEQLVADVLKNYRECGSVESGGD